MKNDKQITIAFLDENETRVTSESVVITDSEVRRSDGSILPTPTITVTSGVATIQLDAVDHLDRLDTLSVDISVLVGTRKVNESATVVVVSEHLFTLQQLRQQKHLSDLGMYTDQELEDARAVATYTFEDYTRINFTPKHFRNTYEGNGANCLRVSNTDVRDVVSCAVNGETAAATLLGGGTIRRTDGGVFSRPEYPGDNNVTVEFIASGSQLSPTVRKAAIAYAKYIVLNDESSIPDRARLMQTEWAMFHLETAAMDKPTGLPEVDSLLNHLRRGWTFQ